MNTGLTKAQLGSNYIANYKKKALPDLADFLESEKQVAAEISKVPAQLISSLQDLTLEGKWLRGSLVQLGYLLAMGKLDQEITKTSNFVEIFHTGLLIHDDVMDEDDTRRGKPSIHAHYAKVAAALEIQASYQRFGESMAINVGDLAFYLSWKKLLQSKLAPQDILIAANTYSHYASRVVYGQALDITTVAIKSVSEKDIYKVFRYKTAEYTGVMPLVIGAQLGGMKDQQKIKALEEYGLHLGWAFQIQDDLLGLFSTKDELGKPIGSDLSDAKNTLLMLCLMNNGDQSARDLQKKLMGKPKISSDELEEMKQALEKSGCRQKVIDMGNEHLIKGKKSISKITSDDEVHQLMTGLIDLMMSREK